jgi:hypothetical protein
MLRHLNKDHVVPKPQLFECLYRLMIAALGEAMHGERRLASCPCVGNGLCELAARTFGGPSAVEPMVNAAAILHSLPLG